MTILPVNRAAIHPTTLFLMLVLMSGIGPFSLQILLPALPNMATTFDISFAQAQLALSLSMVAIAIGMLATGPLADSWGRRNTVIAGTVLFLLGSVLCIFCWDIYSLTAGRIIQAFGGAAGVVVSRAVLRDLYADAQNARAMSFVVVAMVVGPALAPLFGAYLVEWTVWRSVFVPSFVLGLLTLGFILKSLRETKPNSLGPESLVPQTSIFASWKVLFASKIFTYLNIVTACSISVFYAVVSGASYAVQNYMGGGTLDYGYLLIGMSSCFIMGNLISGNIVLRFGPSKLAVFGLVLGFFATVVIFTLVSLGIYQKIPLLICCMVFAASNGFVVANAQSMAINAVPSVAGKASGVTGFTQMFFSAIVVQSVAASLSMGPLAIAVAMLACASLAILLFMPVYKELKKAGS